MEMISKAIVDGSLEVIGGEPSPRSKEIAKTLVEVGDPVREPANRSERRALRAIRQKNATRARQERQRCSRGKVQA